MTAARRIAAALGAAAALLAGGAGVAKDDAAGPTCRIDEQASAGGVTLRGHAASASGWDGRYSLAVRKLGPAGQSNITQGGALRVEAAGEASFGQVAISLEPGARYEAVLTVTGDGRSVECRASGPGAPL